MTAPTELEVLVEGIIGSLSHLYLRETGRKTNQFFLNEFIVIEYIAISKNKA